MCSNRPRTNRTFLRPPTGLLSSRQRAVTRSHRCAFGRRRVCTVARDLQLWSESQRLQDCCSSMMLHDIQLCLYCVRTCTDNYFLKSRVHYTTPSIKKGLLHSQVCKIIRRGAHDSVGIPDGPSMSGVSAIRRRGQVYIESDLVLMVFF